MLTYDEMMLSLLMQVFEDAKTKGIDKGNTERMREVLLANLKSHSAKLSERQEVLRNDLDEEEAEKAKKITTDDIHEGFDSKYVPPKPEPPPIPTHKPTTKTKVQTIEVLNPKANDETAVAQMAFNSSAPGPSTSPGEEDDDDDDFDIPEMTPKLNEFSKLPLKGYEKSYSFLQHNREVYVKGASDALLVAAFTAETKDQHGYSKQCVHQSLLLQYCEKLGKDGVQLFFKRYVANTPCMSKAIY